MGFKSGPSIHNNLHLCDLHTPPRRIGDKVFHCEISDGIDGIANKDSQSQQQSCDQGNSYDFYTHFTLRYRIRRNRNGMNFSSTRTLQNTKNFSSCMHRCESVVCMPKRNFCSIFITSDSIVNLPWRDTKKFANNVYYYCRVPYHHRQ